MVHSREEQIRNTGFPNSFGRIQPSGVTRNGVSDASQLVKSIAHIEDVASRASAAAQTAENRTNGIPWTRLAAIDLLTLLGEETVLQWCSGYFWWQ